MSEVPNRAPEIAPRAAAIDILRGAAAIAVALFHFNEPYPALPDVYHRAVKWGWLGVAAFFVVSGFCIAGARERDGAVRFWFRRLARIYPPYWASLLVVVAVVGLRVATTGTNDVAALPRDFGSWVCTLAALTTPASSVPGLNWAYWSLGYEVAFYVLMGLLAGRRTAVLLGVFSVLAHLLPGFPFDHWCLFGLGVACHRYVQRHYASALALGAVCLGSGVSRLGPAQALAGAVAALIIVFPPRWMAGGVLRPLRAAGGFSYSLYLTHVPIGCYLLPHCLPGNMGRELWPSLLQDAVLLTGSVLFAYGFYRWAEKPSHEFARRFEFPPSPRAAGPAATGAKRPRGPGG